MAHPLKLFLMEHHHHILKYWKKEKFKKMDLVHIDLHDDLRGMLIEKDFCYGIGSWRKNVPAVDEGNFLCRAIQEDILNSLRWFPGVLGGRSAAPGIVKYASDWAAIPHRWKQKKNPLPEYPIRYQEWKKKEEVSWEKDVWLDLDWDFFQGKKIKDDESKKRMDWLLSLSSLPRPCGISLAFSPAYLKEGKEEKYFEFSKKISEKWNAKIEILSKPGPLQKPFNNGLLWPFLRFLRERGWY